MLFEKCSQSTRTTDTTLPQKRSFALLAGLIEVQDPEKEHLTLHPDATRMEVEAKIDLHASNRYAENLEEGPDGEGLWSYSAVCGLSVE